MSGQPQVVFGMPAYNRPDSLPQALESVLGQTCRDFALLVLDDSTTDEIAEVVQSYLSLDSRIYYERNRDRLGMIANWRKCFDSARTRYPQSEYFAWISDHDVWHPRWLEVLVDQLDRHPELVLAYPIALRAFKNSRPAVNRSFDTFRMTDPVKRLSACSQHMMAGNMIYGLFRARALAQAGVFRRVMVPDRQVLLELALLGQFRQVPQLLWYREIHNVFSLKRQRAAFFPNGAPVYTYLPTHIIHCATLVWDLAVRGTGRPAIRRWAGLGFAFVQLYSSIRRGLSRTAPPLKAVRRKAKRIPRLGWLFARRAVAPAGSAQSSVPGLRSPDAGQ